MMRSERFTRQGRLSVAVIPSDAAKQQWIAFPAVSHALRGGY
ncbi:hypothetical protein [uncultured Tateyamaria sp.]|nr:hypothetical protein [uncultured Tateyamaria sp.]